MKSVKTLPLGSSMAGDILQVALAEYSKWK